MEKKVVDLVLSVSDEVVRLLGRKFDNPRHATACLAVTLGRLCEHHGISLDQALIMAKIVSETGNPLPPIKDGP